MVERLCQWHQTNHKLRQQQQLQQTRSATLTGQGSESPVPLAPGTDDDDDVGGSMAYGREAGGGWGRDGGLEDDGILEVDQVLAKELLEDLKEEKSINVTALLLADEEILGP